MTKFTIHTTETAPQQSRQPLEDVRKAYGMVPNVLAVMAESPDLLKGYLALEALFENGSFDATEREVIQMAASFENDCHYCMAAHSVVAGMEKVPNDVIASLRNNQAIGDAKLEALRRFTSAMVRTRGWPSEEDVKALLDAGYSPAQLFEVILGVGLKVLTNYTNHIADTPLDSEFEAGKWTGVKAA